MFTPAIVSEREVGEWEDCVWCSGVMLRNAIAGADVAPATRLEYEGLRFDATGVREGNGDGSNMRELERGLAVRYGLTNVKRGSGWASALANWPVGAWLVLQGLYAALPDRLRVTTFRDAHCMVLGRDRELSAVLLDPLERAGTAPKRITLDEARAYYEALAGAEWIAGKPGGRLTDVAIQIRRQLADAKAGAGVYEFPGASAPVDTFKAVTTIETIGVPMDQSGDHLNLGWRLVTVTTRAIDGELTDKGLYMLTGELSNLRDPDPEPGGPADPAELEQARLEGATAEWDRWHESLGIPERPA